MPELREPETDPTRFIRIADGTVYGYTSLLAKRRDATIVDGYTAAQWFKSQGVENDVTRAYPDTAPLDVKKAARVYLPASSKPNRNVVKAQQKRARAEKLEERAVKLRRMKEADKLQPVPVPVVESEPELPLGDEGVVLGQDLDPVMKGLIEGVSDRR